MDNTPIMLIRHAEKAQGDEQAVNREGRPDPNSLSVTGWMRAGALVRFFAMPDAAVGAPSRVVRPVHLLAARPSEAHPSTRPQDTLQPLAQALGLTIDLRFASEQPLSALAEHLRRLDDPVLVCWRHDGLPALADELVHGADAPSAWPAQRYDLVWIVDPARPRPTLAQLPQRLLPGDVSQALPRRIATNRSTQERGRLEGDA